MTEIENLLALEEYSLSFSEKECLLLPIFSRHLDYHRENCEAFGNIAQALNFSVGADFNSLPYLPVRLFKELELKSIPSSKVFKTITSSGTTSGVPSRIYLDRETAKLQTKALSNIICSFIGNQRLPMVLCDSLSVVKDRSSFSARGAGLLGMQIFGREHLYLLNEDMHFEITELEAFAAKFSADPCLFFGFTFMVWDKVLKILEDGGRQFSFADSILFHSGGWKKLEGTGVTNRDFKRAVETCLGVAKVHNYYGMVEQVGSVFVECEEGYFHAPNTAEIVIRDWRNWGVVPDGTEGVIQCLSVLPKSYPGFSILTEDLGTKLGVDDCRCGRKGSYFVVSGRIPQSERRGCSDTYSEG